MTLFPLCNQAGLKSPGGFPSLADWSITCFIHIEMKFHLALAGSVFVATGLSAQTTTFAAFTLLSPLSRAVVFDNDQEHGHRAKATFDTANVFTGMKVDFEFNPDLVFSGPLAALNGPQAAEFIMKSATDDKAVGVSHSLWLQPGIGGVMEFLLKKPIDGKNLLLKVTYSNADLFTSNATGLELAGENPADGTNITYSSDFLNFSTPASNAWASLFSVSIVKISTPSSIAIRALVLMNY